MKLTKPNRNKFAIVVEFKPEVLSYSRQVQAGIWHIVIGDRKEERRKDAVPQDKFIVLLHELGHAIGQAVFGDIQTPADKMAVNMGWGATPNTYAEEVRAWGIAEKIFPVVRKFSLSTYEQNKAPAVPGTVEKFGKMLFGE